MVKELRIALTVENFDEALAFYRDTLGLEQLELWEAPGSRAVLLSAGRATDAMTACRRSQARLAETFDVQEYGQFNAIDLPVLQQPGKTPRKRTRQRRRLQSFALASPPTSPPYKTALA